MCPNKEIIKLSSNHLKMSARIPLALQQIFLASQRGDDVEKLKPPEKLGFRIFRRFAGQTRRAKQRPVKAPTTSSLHSERSATSKETAADASRKAMSRRSSNASIVSHVVGTCDVSHVFFSRTLDLPITVTLFLTGRSSIPSVLHGRSAGRTWIFYQEILESGGWLLLPSHTSSASVVWFSGQSRHSSVRLDPASASHGLWAFSQSMQQLWRIFGTHGLSSG